MIHHLKDPIGDDSMIVNKSFGNPTEYKYIISQKESDEMPNVGSRIKDPERGNTLMKILNMWLTLCEKNKIYLSFPREYFKFFLNSWKLYLTDEDFTVKKNSATKTASSGAKNVKISARNNIFAEYAKSPRNFSSILSKSEEEEIDAVMFIKDHDIFLPETCYLHQAVPDFKSVSYMENYSIDSEPSVDENYARISLQEDVERHAVIKLTPTAVYLCQNGACHIAPPHVCKDVPIDVLNQLINMGILYVNLEAIIRSSGSKPTRFVDVCSIKMKVANGALDTTRCESTVKENLAAYEGKTERNILDMEYPERLVFLKKLGLNTTDIIRDVGSTTGSYLHSYIRKHISDPNKPCYKYHSGPHKAVIVGYDRNSVYIAYRVDANKLSVKTKQPVHGQVAEILSSVIMNSKNLLLEHEKSELSACPNECVVFTRHKKEKSQKWSVVDAPKENFNALSLGILVKFSLYMKEISVKSNERVSLDNTIEPDDVTLESEYRDVHEETTSVKTSTEIKKLNNLSNIIGSSDPETLFKLLSNSGQIEALIKKITESNNSLTVAANGCCVDEKKILNDYDDDC
ncbi:hypothetical protein QAD02_001469 [Eretmocerus hayati]|uniref:Uncharacterized protein n=1 Tax=Eretmocerus hayati TaxID=131215 RepID=A0ACC2NG84_9HYME|nr:hypothetical protein QAD02_001469 [Eretmocerus hayati]